MSLTADERAAALASTYWNPHAWRSKDGEP